MTQTEGFLGALVQSLPEISAVHARSSKTYQLLEALVGGELLSSELVEGATGLVDMGPLGELKFPFEQMGAVSSIDLFGLDELIIFAYYWLNRDRYRTAADIGANLGLHSLLMSRCGWAVTAYEPDPNHLEVLRRNLLLNEVSAVQVVEAAVSDTSGFSEFVRVQGNTTSSHLAGAKDPYGDVERFKVTVDSIKDIMQRVDFVKLDVEGQEKAIITCTDSSDWDGTDMMLEIGSLENAEAILEHIEVLGLNGFAQKTGWSRAEVINDVPTTYSEGSFFITTRQRMLWA